MIAQENDLKQQMGFLSPIFFNFFLEKGLSDALEEQNGKGNIDDRTIINQRFADDFGALAEKKDLDESLDKVQN